MKQALILHGTGATHADHWFSWLAAALARKGYRVWVPDLPGADRPDIARYTEYLLANQGDRSQPWSASSETIIIGHSSGAVEILGMLDDPAFPETARVRACFLVGAFAGDLGREDLRGMNKKFDPERIRRHCGELVFVHSDDDPVCPVGDAKRLAATLHALFVEIHGRGHCTVEEHPELTAFPELLKIIERELAGPSPSVGK